MSLLPSQLEVSPSPDEPRMLDIDGEKADATFDALGSETAREVLATVYADPKTPAQVRDAVGTSLQNVHYHLDRLEGADLIEPVGSGYSSKGNEMTVYGPVSQAVVLFAGEPDDSSRLRECLKRLFGLFIAVVISTLVFATFHTWWAAESVTVTLDGGDGMAGPEAVDAPPASAADAVTALDPALAFFLGGCAVVVAVGLWWWLRPRLRSTTTEPSR